MVYVPVPAAQTQWHTYAVNWTSDAITWFVDGAAVRTLQYADAQGGTRFPQTPMKLKLGIWAGGDAAAGNLPGTVTWAGGAVDYSKGPFTMDVEYANIINYSPADTYKYKDNSGNWQSIDVIGGSAGGIVTPGQQSAIQSSLTSSTFIASTGTPIPVDPLSATSTNSLSPTLLPAGYTNSTSTAAATGASNSTASASATKSGSASASKTSGPAKVTANAASYNGVAGSVAGSALAALFMVLFA